MSLKLVRPLRMDDTDDPNFEYPEPFNDGDAASAAGFFAQYGSGFDLNVGITRDASGNLILEDPHAGVKTLSDLIPGATNYDYLLTNDPDSISNTYTVSYGTGHRVSNETWIGLVSSLTIKTSDYTYSGNNVHTEVDKVFGSDGVTIVAQQTIIYTYSGSTLMGASITRDI